MIHTGHVAMVHAGHTAHVCHSQARRITQLRNSRFHTFFGGQRCPGIAGTPHGFSENGVGLLIFRVDDHIIGFRHTDPELVHVNGLNVVAIGLYNRHVQTGNPYVEVGHGRGVDEPQPDAFSGLKKASPVLLGTFAVDQARKALQVLNVRFHHPHVTPGHAVPNGVHQTVFGRVRKKLPHGLLLTVVVIRYHFQVAHDAVTGMGVLVSQLHHVLAVITKRLTLFRFDHNGTIGAIRLLKTRVAVEPVSACLLDRKFISKGFTRLDAWETYAGYTVLIKRKDQPMPVNGRHLIQVIGHVDLDVFAFLEAHHRSRGCAVVSDAFLHKIAGINFNAVDRQIVLTGHNHGWHQQAQKPCQKAWFHLCCSKLHVIEAGPRNVSQPRARGPQLSELLEIDLTVHPGLIVARHVAGKFDIAFIRELPNHFFTLARFQQHAVRVVMLHGMAIPHIHIHHVVVQLAALDDAMLNHHHHFLSMSFVHVGSANIELMDEVSLVLHHEANGFTRLYTDFFGFVVVVVHLDSYGSAGLRRFARFTACSAVPVATIMGASRKRCCRH